jgi:hypothetical protein
MSTAAKRKDATSPPKTLRELGLENYHVVEIHRSELVNAVYNPRKISDHEKSKLREVLKRHGLVAPITWNHRSKNIVGGHQRIGLLDDIAETSDYTLHVAVIDVDEAREKELNIALNNTNAMGSFDQDLLKAVFADSAVSITGAGFSPSDMVQMFGESVFANRSVDLEAFASTLTKIASQYDAISKKNREKASSEHFLVFIFPSGAHVDQFIEQEGLDQNRYQNGQALADKLKALRP